MRVRSLVTAANLAAVGTLIVAWALAGCSFNPPPAGAPAVRASSSHPDAVLAADVAHPQSGITTGESVAALREELIRSKVQVSAVLDALAQLSAQGAGDLRPAYDEFSREVDLTQARSESVRKQAETTRTRAREYLRNWQQQTLLISDLSIREQATQRQSTVRGDVNRIVAASQHARDAFGPFVSDLDDLRSYLATDLTPRGVAAIQPGARKAMADAKQLQQRLDAVIAELDRAASELEPPSVAQAAELAKIPVEVDDAAPEVAPALETPTEVAVETPAEETPEAPAVSAPSDPASLSPTASLQPTLGSTPEPPSPDPRLEARLKWLLTAAFLATVAITIHRRISRGHPAPALHPLAPPQR